eukprot:scaffold32377_cov34-Tisochrysis_lutea.AAC.3
MSAAPITLQQQQRLPENIEAPRHSREARYSSSHVCAPLSPTPSLGCTSRSLTQLQRLPCMIVSLCSYTLLPPYPSLRATTANGAVYRLAF